MIELMHLWGKNEVKMFNSPLGMENDDELYAFSAIKVKLVDIVSWIRPWKRLQNIYRFDTCASFYCEQFALYFIYLTNVLLINYTWVGSTFNKLSENYTFIL